MEKIHDIAFQLHDMLINSNEYLSLKEKEKQMLEDDICKKLIDDYQEISKQYDFNKNEEILKKMHNCKLLLDENNYVKEYKQAYKNYQIFIGKVTDVVFDGFSSQTLIDKIIRAK